MTARHRRSTRLPAAALLTATLLLPGVAAAEPSISAWDDLVRHFPGAITQLSLDQRAVLEILGPDEARRWSTGSPTDEVLTLDGRTLADWLVDRKLTGPSYEMGWWSVDGGGGASSGGGFTLTGTIGQHDQAVSAGGPYTVRGGFWAPTAFGTPFFSDGFEDGTTDAWAATSP